MSGPTRRKVAAAATLTLCAALAAGCAQPAIEGQVADALTPSATPTLGVATTDLRAVDLAEQARTDLRVPGSLRALLAECPDCLAPIRWQEITGDGREDAVLTIAEQSVPLATIVFTLVDGRTDPAFIHVGSHATMAIEGRELVLTRAMFARDDPAGQPTGAPLISRFRWNDGRFVQTSRTGGSPGTFPYDSDDKVIL